MLTPAVVNILTYFYPIGNTPAISLTQAIPPNVPTDILLLGCGDVRNILFTSHIDDRSMDITCCDIQKAVIGELDSATENQRRALKFSIQSRNILLLSLIIDDSDGQNDDSLWSIYYHMYLDKKALDLLRSQTNKLLELSTAMDTWQQSKYGSRFEFCDSATLTDVRKMWELYGVEHEGAQASRFRRRFEAVLQQARNQKDGKGCSSTTIVLTGFRSAVPAHIGALGDLDALHKHYWKHGSVQRENQGKYKAPQSHVSDPGRRSNHPLRH